MLITIEEYIKQYNDKLDKYTEPYLLNLSELKLRHDNIPGQFLNKKSWMLKWNDNDAACWAGPFEGNYVFCSITDYNHKYPRLKSIAEIKEHQKTYEKYSSYNWPHDYVESILGKDWNICYIGEKKLSRSDLTNLELDLLISKANEENLIFYKRKINSDKEDWSLETVSKEFPVSLYMCGNDDCSYTKLFRSFKEAENYLRELSILNNFDIIYKDFVFTN